MKSESLFIDATFFFVSSAPVTVKAEEKVRADVSGGCVLAEREREEGELSPLRAELKVAQGRSSHPHGSISAPIPDA